MADQAFDVDAAIKQLGQLARSIRTAGAGSPRDTLEGQYRAELDRLLDSGWPEALGADNEIPDDMLPSRYLEQRTRVIDGLEIQLGDCATKYRSAPKGSAKNDEAIREYHRAFDELLRITGKVIGLDPDSELLDEDMPKAYVDHWT